MKRILPHPGVVLYPENLSGFASIKGRRKVSLFLADLSSSLKKSTLYT